MKPERYKLDVGTYIYNELNESRRIAIIDPIDNDDDMALLQGQVERIHLLEKKVLQIVLNLKTEEMIPGTGKGPAEIVYDIEAEIDEWAKLLGYESADDAVAKNAKEER